MQMDVAVFLASCQSEMALLETLQLTLQQEQQAILRLDAFQIDTLAQQKMQQLQQLQAVRGQRLALQQAAGVAEADSWSLWLQQAPATVQQEWQALELALMRLKALNDINADIADDRMRLAGEVIDTLRGAMQGGYGRHGTLSSSGMPGSRRLGSA
jgi:flagellar biosynthesis/type III secretory pathway chaperone